MFGRRFYIPAYEEPANQNVLPYLASNYAIRDLPLSTENTLRSSRSNTPANNAQQKAHNIDG